MIVSTYLLFLRNSGDYGSSWDDNFSSLDHVLLMFLLITIFLLLIPISLLLIQVLSVRGILNLNKLTSHVMLIR